MLYNWDAAGIITLPEGSFKFPVSDMLMPTTVCVEERQKAITLFQWVVYGKHNKSKILKPDQTYQVFWVQNYKKKKEEKISKFALLRSIPAKRLWAV